VDADHGYGNALGTIRAVRDLESAGVAAMTIEDAILPAQYPYKEDVRLISILEMTQKLCAATQARKDPSTVIIGRTNALSVSLEDTVERVRAYSQTGVDAIFVLGFKHRGQIEAVRSVTTLPLMTGGFTTDIDHDFMVSSGIRVALKGHTPFQASVKAIYDALNHQKHGMEVQDIQQNLASPDIIAIATGADEFEEWTKNYLV
jgi:carboxyvinyl-carboxyphosphonate phosphorylmutase